MYANYRGRCIGRLLHFMYDYSIKDCDICIFDGKSQAITVRGKLLATYEWDKDEQGNDTDIPTFEFFGETAKFWESAQKEKKAQVVMQDEFYEKLFGRSKDKEKQNESR